MRRGRKGEGRGRKGPKGREKESPFKMSAYGPEYYWNTAGHNFIELSALMHSLMWMNAANFMARGLHQGHVGQSVTYNNKLH